MTTLKTMRDLLKDHHASSPQDDPDNPGAFADALARHGLTLVSSRALTEMEAATREAVAQRTAAAEFGAHAVVDLLGHTRRIGRLTNCAEIPGFVQLAEADGTVRWINPHKAVFEVLVVTEAEAEELARPARAAWDSERGRVVARWDEGYLVEDDPPFGDEGEGE